MTWLLAPQMIAKQVSSISNGAHRITTECSSIDTPSCSVRGKPNSTISDDEFVTSIYKEKEHNAYNVMALLDMWQCFERDILSEVSPTGLFLPTHCALLFLMLFNHCATFAHP